MENLEEKLERISVLEKDEDILSVNLYTNDNLSEEEGADLALSLIERAVAISKDFKKIPVPKFD